MNADAAAWLFLLIAAGLDVCFIWALWESEQDREPEVQRRRKSADR
jgi:hypothetical protein